MEVRVLSTAPKYPRPEKVIRRRRVSPAFSFFRNITSAIRTSPRAATTFKSYVGSAGFQPAFFPNATTQPSVSSPRSPSPPLLNPNRRNITPHAIAPQKISLTESDFTAPRHAITECSNRQVNVNFSLSTAVNVHALFSQIEILYSINSNRPFRTIASAFLRD
jgi:hypothetical protein